METCGTVLHPLQHESHHYTHQLSVDSLFSCLAHIINENQTGKPIDTLEQPHKEKDFCLKLMIHNLSQLYYINIY